ncbi:MAG: S8 family peptidase [Acetivibrio sp.]
MDNAKLDNSLNLALNTSEDIRMETEELDVGYNSKENTWELIVRYHGDILKVAEEIKATAVVLSGGYAILIVKQEMIEELSEFEEIEYIEKPKKLEFAVTEGIAASCILPLQREKNGLYGKNVICAVIDSGIDYTHPDFRREEDGTTRILALWDQTTESGKPPKGYVRGTLFTQKEINRLLLEPEYKEGENILLPSRDLSGHGTHIAGICAGNGRASQGKYTGVAPQSDLLIVKLGDSVGKSFPRTTNLMEAIQFVVDFATQREEPVAINISFGNSYGSHSGRSLLETYLDNMAAIWKSVICIGSGNEGGAARHKGGTLEENKSEEIEFAVGNYETSLNLQVWKNYYDDFNVELISPSGKSVGVLTKELGSHSFTLEKTNILFYYGAARPYSGLQEIYIDFIPENQYMASGIWKIRLIPRKILRGNYELWIPSGGGQSTETRFLRPTETMTLTIPSTSARAVTVGAYDSFTDSYAYFSGRGFTWENQWIKPDIVAPGVDITSCAPGGGYTTKTGTSMATPFVTGSAALMMEWGIVKKKDPFLYGEKVKVYLIKGARRLPGFSEWPNPMVGWGALCVGDSLPL